MTSPRPYSSVWGPGADITMFCQMCSWADRCKLKNESRGRMYLNGVQAVVGKVSIPVYLEELEGSRERCNLIRILKTNRILATKI